MKTLQASDRRSLIRLASSLPKGSENRRAILAGLKKARIEAGDPTEFSDDVKDESVNIRTGGISGGKFEIQLGWEDESGEIYTASWDGSSFVPPGKRKKYPTSEKAKAALVAAKAAAKKIFPEHALDSYDFR